MLYVAGGTTGVGFLAWWELSFCSAMWISFWNKAEMVGASESGSLETRGAMAMLVWLMPWANPLPSPAAWMLLMWSWDSLTAAASAEPRRLYRASR